MTLYVGFLLHIYQPPTQKPVILKKIIKESYKPLFELLLEKRTARMTFNINGSLLELLDLFQETELIDNIKALVRTEQIDLLGSSCYHAILPLIPEEEIIRQIELNEKLHSRIIGDKAITSGGFWLPEMAYDYRVIAPLEKKNYSWSVISSVAIPSNKLPDTYLPVINDDFILYFRNDLLSNLISFRNPSVDEFIIELTKGLNYNDEDQYVILAMDGETYGHHIKGLIETFLKPLINEIDNNEFIELIKISELPDIFPEKRNIIAKSSSWSTTAEDINQGVPFPLWSNPKNRIHNLQLTVLNHALFLVSHAQMNIKKEEELGSEIQAKFKNARTWLDQGLHSCQLWWASKRPWYSAEMILKGLNQLILASSEALKVIMKLCDNENEKNKARRIFDEIFEAQKELYLIV